MIRSAALLALLSALGLAAPALAKEDCPAPLQPPTREQMAEYMKASKDRGALWTIEKDGRTSHLFGTIHLGRIEWLVPGPKLMSVLQGAGALAVEVDISSPDLRPQMMAAMAAAPPLALTKADRTRLAKLTAAECLPAAALAPLHPVMQVVTVSTLIGRRDGFYPELAQEGPLIGFMNAAKRPVVSLETMALQMAVLLPKDAAEARLAFDEGLRELESPDARQMMRYMIDAWERGDLEAIDTLEEICRCEPTPQQREGYVKLNDDRNVGLARRIAEEHAKGVPILAAVGILHMTGDKAIPKLLAEQGFEVTRVAY
jgi:hypothetical protein